MTGEEIKAVARQAKITDYLTERGVDMIKAGRRVKCACPLHKETDPSFYVGTKADGTEVFKCFGCNEHGDVITLVQKLEGVGFVEAMKRLAFRVGIKLTDGKGEPAIRVETPLKDILRNLSPEDHYGVALSRMLWMYLQAREFCDDAIDKASKAYAAYDRMVGEDDVDGIRGLMRDVQDAYRIEEL